MLVGLICNQTGQKCRDQRLETFKPAKETRQHCPVNVNRLRVKSGWKSAWVPTRWSPHTVSASSVVVGELYVSRLASLLHGLTTPFHPEPALGETGHQTEPACSGYGGASPRHQ